MVDTQSNNDKEEEHQESIAERSARLEAEAMGLYKKNYEEGSADDDSAETHEPAETETAPTAISANAAAEIETLKAELAKTKEQMLRVAADAENTKRRALKDRDDAGKFAIQGFARDLVNVADNLRRALEAVPADLKEEPRVANLTDGIEATERELLRSFEKNGIVKINPKGEVFDPHFHEVMFEAPVPGFAAGTIIEVIETGYTLHGRILRPARVGVAKSDNSAETPTASTEPGSNFDGEA